MDLRQHCIDLLSDRGVTVDDLADCAVFLQKAYFPELTHQDMIESVMDVLGKREVQYTIMTGIAIDEAADSGAIKDETLSKVLLEDEGLYGVDEVLAYSICNVYGSIALTNFGYIRQDQIRYRRKAKRQERRRDLSRQFQYLPRRHRRRHRRLGRR